MSGKRTVVRIRPSKKFPNSGISGAKDVDLISNLPEGILSHILSCLPIKDAVQTCVLSKVWEYKWTSIYSIIVDDEELFPNRRNDNACFIKVMDKILLYSLHIRNFGLSCDERYKSHVETWISAVFRRNVESVTLFCGYDYGPEADTILPRSLLHCTSLRELEICMCCMMKVPGKMCFPNLSSLHLQGVQIRNDNSSTDTLTLTFPVLATLVLCSCRWLNVRFVEIYAPMLYSFSSEPLYEERAFDYLIKIFGARLGMFLISGPSVENFLLTGSTVFNAVLHNGSDTTDEVAKIGLQIQKLLTELSSISELQLSCYVAQVIAQTKSDHILPKFDKLGLLILEDSDDMRNHPANIEGLFEVLHAAPFLKELVIDMECLVFMDSQEGYDYASVPSCVVSHLKRVEFKYFENMAHHLRLAMFVLKHGAKLKQCSFSHCYMQNEELGTQIQKFPKASKYVRVVVVIN